MSSNKSSASKTESQNNSMISLCFSSNDQIENALVQPSSPEQLIELARLLRSNSGAQTLYMGALLSRSRESSDREVYASVVDVLAVSGRTDRALRRLDDIYGHDRKTFAPVGQCILELFARRTTPSDVFDEFMNHQTVDGEPVVGMSYREVERRINDHKPAPDDSDDDDANETASSTPTPWAERAMDDMRRVVKSILELESTLSEKIADPVVAEITHAMESILDDVRVQQKRLGERIGGAVVERHGAISDQDSRKISDATENDNVDPSAPGDAIPALNNPSSNPANPMGILPKNRRRRSPGGDLNQRQRSRRRASTEASRSRRAIPTAATLPEVER